MNIYDKVDKLVDKLVAQRVEAITVLTDLYNEVSYANPTRPAIKAARKLVAKFNRERNHVSIRISR